MTICFPSAATGSQIKELNECSRNFCREKKIPARCAFEGPGKHQHIALGIPFCSVLEAKWKARLTKRWKALFGTPLGEKEFLWKPDIEPDKIASYLSKTSDKNGRVVKGSLPWLTINPAWEVGFKTLAKGVQPLSIPPGNPREISVTSELVEPSGKESHSILPTYTVEASGKARETSRPICQTCRTRWGRNLWEGSCVCTGDVSPNTHGI